MTQEKRRAWIQAATVAALYVAAGRLGLMWAIPPGVATPVWPASGLALAAVLTWGPGVWPGIWLGSALVNVGTLWSAAPGALAAAAVVITIAAGSTLQALLGAWALRRWTGTDFPLGSARAAFQFAGIEAAACLLAATVGSVSLCLARVAPWADFPAHWSTWWLGDVVGVLLAAPCWLVAAKALAGELAAPALLELGVFEACLVLLSQGMFGGWPFQAALGRPFTFFLIPSLVWGAFRFGPQGAVAGIVTAAVAALAGTTARRGPFGAGPSDDSVFQLQSWLGVLAMTVLVLAAALEERRRAASALQSAHDELELVVRRRTEELERANRELEAFSHSVAHDLRAPLRAMGGYAGLLLGAYTAKLDERGRHFLDRIISSSERMAGMIDDLLNLSLVAQRPMGVGPVELSALAEEVAEEIRRGSPPRKVEFRIAPGLSARGDAGLLRLVLSNLLSNAWKFTAWRPEAVIEFGAEEQGGARAFFVRDNGAGFDTRETARLFHAFERLHTREEFPGTGVGLATVRRIVERHGGRVWARGELGRGASFYFSL